MEKMSKAEGIGENPKIESVRRFLRFNISNVAIIGICLLYITSAVLQPERTDMTLYEVIVGSIFAFAASMGINSLYTGKAITDGLLKKSVVDAKEDYDKHLDKIMDCNWIDDLDDFCREQNKINYRRQRIRILSSEGLTYDECFDNNGNSKNVFFVKPHARELPKVGIRMWVYRRRKAKRQTKAYIRACYLRLSELSVGELMGDGNSNDPYKVGRKVSVFRKQSRERDAISKTITSIALGVYCADMIANFSWIKLASMVVQVVFFNICGILKYVATVTYVEEEYHDRLVSISRIFAKFKKEVESNSGEVSREHGHYDEVVDAESAGDRELHAAAS